MMRKRLLLAVYLTTLFVTTLTYHDHFQNSQFHCWPENGANQDNGFECPFVNFSFDEDPPDEIIQNEHFVVSYRLSFNTEEVRYQFFQWLLDEGWLEYDNTTALDEFCRKPCEDPTQADESNCCVHHINIHSCPQAALDELHDMCGPWINPKGEVFTHTQAMATHIKPWVTDVVLTNVGYNFIIGHIKIGKLQMALGKRMLVHPAANCGDGHCDDRTETCASCKQDCCPGLPLNILIVIIVISCLLGLALILIPAVWYYQKRKFLYDETWIVDWDDIKASTGYKGFGSVRSIASIMSQSSLGTNGVPAVHGQIFCETGIYQGKIVSIKKIQKQSFQLSRAVRVEIRNVRVLDHTNISKFIGIVTEIDNFSIIAEYCNKGSLNDVLMNEEIPLNWGFRLSFAQDICRGMEYLHNHKMFHGRLKSSNCIIDDRWVCKLCDYGFQYIRKPDEDPELGETFGSLRDKRINRQGSGKESFISSLRMNRKISGFLRKDTQTDMSCTDSTERGTTDSPLPMVLEREDKINRVYRPPEANLDEDHIYQPTTDVYSFGIILIEIGGRTEISPPEETVYDPLWRPELPDMDGHDTDPDNSLPLANRYLDLIRHCWDERPSARPVFSEIKRHLHNINPNKENPVDMMMKLMEKYSKHLETIVAERTFELVEEKKKTDRLLYAMLPRSVADDLKQGNPVSAEKYDQCTIFFSDIVGFTNLSSSSTPLEVVELLNQMYTAFDSIVDGHDVYKVETIGDAYMVVSGLPVRNGEQHANEIATMGLEIVMFCRGFRVPHRPNQIVNIRAGIHSGPVVTGVVGLKMPRYCLFGDTVNMASRMESTGEALKIQVSPDTHDILKHDKNFGFQYRGEIEIKGKGTKKTHWLLSKGGLEIKNCLSPETHRRIFKGAKVAPPNPLTSQEFPKSPEPPKKDLPPLIKPPPPRSPLLNGHEPPPYSPLIEKKNASPLSRGAPERDSATSRDRLLGNGPNV